MKRLSRWTAKRLVDIRVAAPLFHAVTMMVINVGEPPKGGATARFSIWKVTWKP